MSTAIICSSASTFKVLLKSYLPRIWSSAGSRSKASGASRAPYDRSYRGRFEMKPFDALSNKSISNRKYGVEGLTVIGNESEEAIMRPQIKVDMVNATFESKA
jgi:hypothetical protein